jgi:hypothetical protein
MRNPLMPDFAKRGIAARIGARRSVRASMHGSRVQALRPS